MSKKVLEVAQKIHMGLQNTTSIDIGPLKWYFGGGLHPTSTTVLWGDGQRQNGLHLCLFEERGGRGRNKDTHFCSLVFFLGSFFFPGMPGSPRHTLLALRQWLTSESACLQHCALCPLTSALCQVDLLGPVMFRCFAQWRGTSKYVCHSCSPKTVQLPCYLVK